MPTKTDTKGHEAQIRELIDDWADALRAKDVDRLMSHYSANIVSFDLAPPLQYQGADSLRKSLQTWFSTFRGPVGFEIRGLDITADEAVAFSRSLNRITGSRTNGEETDVWVRATVCYSRSAGKWVITHEHTSVPLYMDGSEKAALDLKP
ncbi:MAG: DUF4440 domain-containing protein [Acidobacteria bacterium]|nr:MAG: DUF4440 domain-containing protein [Acidobacteriota bacterium]